MKTIILDTSRPDILIRNLLDKVNKLHAFFDAKVDILEDNATKMQTFINKFGGEELTIGNMFLSGMSNDVVETDSRMIATASFTLNKEYKNLKSLTLKMHDEWIDLFGDFNNTKIHAKFYDYKITGKTVTFEIWVK